MTGLISKDFIVFKKKFKLLYRFACAVLLVLAVLLLSKEGAIYTAICIPAVGMAFLTEIVKADEQSEWKDYLPVLPITSHDIVLSRYIFSGLLLISLSIISFAACAVSAAIRDFSLATVMPGYFSGIIFGVLMMCFGIPGGYFFKNETCTGAMMWGCMVYGIARSTKIDIKLLSIGSPLISILALAITILMLCVSYMVSLWIYTTKRYEKIKMRKAQKA